ncbi:MAG: trypsin-like serine protease [Nannocystaceae bacterium]
MRTRLPTLSVFSVALGVSSLVSPAVRAEAPRWFSLEETNQRIVGGEPTNLCEWPTTVSIGGCSATLIHPRVIIYAAHCGDTPAIVRFGERYSGGPGRQAAIEHCEVNPAYQTAPGTDQAFCVLVERHAQKDIPIVPAVMGCEAEELLKVGAEVALVGFGQDENGASGVKRKVRTMINSVSSEVSMGGDGMSSCFGDSGGPAYVMHPDGSWRVFGITSYGVAEECGGQAFYSVMHLGMPWIEGRLLEAYDIDITPCFDTDGTWNPGPDCGSFPQDAATGYGDWDNGCSGGPTGAWSSACGAGFDTLPPDEDAPTVAIASPSNLQRFDGEAPVDVRIAVSADDGEGWGVESVRLVIDGEEVADSVDDSDPYKWTLPLSDGEHTIEAIALDRVGNGAISEAVVIGINVDVVIPPPPQTGDTGADGGSSAAPGGDDDAPGDGTKGGCGCTAGTRGVDGALWSILAVCGWAGVRRSRARRRL